VNESEGISIPGGIQNESQDDVVMNKQSALFRLSADLAAVIVEGDIWSRVVEGLHETLGYDFVALFMRDNQSGNRQLKASAGFVNPVETLKPGEGLSEKPFLDGKLQYTPDVTIDSRYAYGAGGSEVDVPVWIEGEVEGVLVAESGEGDVFSQHDQDVLTAAAHITGIAIEKARLYEQAQREIEERKRIQVEISHQKEYYEALLVNSPAAVVAADLNSFIVSWNPSAEKLFGYTYEEVAGKSLDPFVANNESIKDEAQSYSDQVLNSGRVQVVTKRTRKDGTLVDVELLALPIIVGGDKVGFVAIYHDLTELKRVERELRSKNEKMERELALAGEIQNSFLPRNPPIVPGWQISTRLLPANETSGDFLDIRKLANGNLVFFVADVVEKGVGAALFMTLSWSLLRIFSDEYPAEPQRVFSEVNNRILEDTTSGQFLTIFYGILDPDTGKLIYCNAGHCPPFLVKGQASMPPKPLIRTGMPLAVQSGEIWGSGIIELDHGDLLLLYTDGVTEGFNEADALYGEQRLVKVLMNQREKTAEEISEAVLKDVKNFEGSKTQSDDIAVMVIRRD
jgi:PAS domain S-box-containing protein